MSEITLRDGTVVRHLMAKGEQQRDLWEVEYPDGSRETTASERPLDAREAMRMLEERWPERWGKP